MASAKGSSSRWTLAGRSANGTIESWCSPRDAIHAVQAKEANDLAVRWNCKAGKCGSCSAEINGRPRLLCMTRMSTFGEGDTITITPLRTFPVIRDLVTDVSFNYEKAREIPAFHPPKELQPGEYRVVWADGQPEQTAGTNLHTSFRLSPGAGSVALVMPLGNDLRVFDYLNYTNLPANWRGEVGRITPDLIRKTVPEYRDCIFYISGPRGMVDSFKESIHQLGAGALDIRTDYFAGLA